MQSHYEINVSSAYKKNEFGDGMLYRHLFATSPRSCTNKSEVQRVFRELRDRFPFPEFKIRVTYWEGIGTGINFDDLLNN